MFGSSSKSDLGSAVYFGRIAIRQNCNWSNIFDELPHFSIDELLKKW